MVNMNQRAPLPPPVEFFYLSLREVHDTSYAGMESVVSSEISVFPRPVCGSSLSDDDAPRPDLLAAEELDAQALALTIPNVTGGAAGFLVCHRRRVNLLPAKGKRKSPKDVFW
jgi:hypothetical protein